MECSTTVNEIIKFINIICQMSKIDKILENFLIFFHDYQNNGIILKFQVKKCSQKFEAGYLLSNVLIFFGLFCLDVLINTF